MTEEAKRKTVMNEFDYCLMAKDKMDENSGKVDILKYRLFHNYGYTKKDYLELKEDIADFIKNEATEEEKMNY